MPDSQNTQDLGVGSRRSWAGAGARSMAAGTARRVGVEAERRWGRGIFQVP